MGFKKAQMGLWPKMTQHSLNKVQNSLFAQNGLNMSENDPNDLQKGSKWTKHGLKKALYGLNMAEDDPKNMLQV